MAKLKICLLVDIIVLALGICLIALSCYSFSKGIQNELVFAVGLLGGVFSVIGLFLIIDIKSFQSRLNKSN